MNKVERYEAIIRSAIEVQQLKIEIKRKLTEVAENITANELKYRHFDSNDAKKAFSILAADMLEIKECSYARSKLVYKDVDIILHSDPSCLGGDALKHVLKELKSNEIFEA